jgi:hypothetical protein
MIKKIIFLTVLLSFFINNINAQEDYIEFDSIKSEFQRKKIIIKLALLSQLDVNSPSLQIGLEIKLSEFVGIHQEFGYVNNWLNPLYTLTDHNYSQKHKIKNGFKYILEPRFYLFNKDKIFSSRLFFAPALDLRYVVIQRKEWVTVNNSFQQNMRYNVRKLAYGFNLKFGFTTSIRKKIPIEIAVGLGARYVTLKNTLPANAIIGSGVNNFIFGRPKIEGNYWFPSAYFGMLLQLPVFK